MKRDLAEVLSKFIDYKLATLRVAMPAQVNAYYPATQTVDAQPVVSSAIALDDGALVEELPSLYGIPVEFPRGNGYIVMFPLAAGDTGLLEICDFSLDLWRATGQAGAPSDLRAHALGNAVFRPGLSPSTHPVANQPNALVIGRENGTQIVIDPTSGIATVGPVGSTQDFVALAAKVLSELNAVKTDLQAVKTTFDSHVHILTLAAQAGAGGTGTAAPPASGIPAPHTPSSVAGTVLKGAQ
jgi:hypothetical protein